MPDPLLVWQCANYSDLDGPNIYKALRKIKLACLRVYREEIRRKWPFISFIQDFIGIFRCLLGAGLTGHELIYFKILSNHACLICQCRILIRNVHFVVFGEWADAFMSHELRRVDISHDSHRAILCQNDM